MACPGELVSPYYIGIAKQYRLKFRDILSLFFFYEKFNKMCFKIVGGNVKALKLLQSFV